MTNISKTKLQDILSCCNEKATNCQDEIQSSERFVVTGESGERFSVGANPFVYQRRELLKLASEPEHFAKLQVFKVVVNSSEETVLESWRELDECTEKVWHGKVNLVVEKSGFLMGLISFFVRQELLQAAMVARHQIACALCRYVTVLAATALELF